MAKAGARSRRDAQVHGVKPHSPACERNRDPILGILRRHFATCRHVLEIGSGTGQHAVHFAAAMPWLTWQCSDVAEHLPGIRMWLDEASLPNTPAPVELDVAHGPWPGMPAATAHAPIAAGSPAGAIEPARHPQRSGRFDAVFSANTLHIMGWPEVHALFAGLPHMLADDAKVAIYGPFNYEGAYTSDSNRDFDSWLKARDPESGIRDFEAVDVLALGVGLQLVDDVAMPANNRCLVWRRGIAAPLDESVLLP